MSFVRSLFSLTKIPQIINYLKESDKIKYYFFHPFTLISIAAVGIPFATIYCTEQKANNSQKEPFKLPDAEQLSLKKMIQHSSYLTVNAVLQILQLTTAAVIDASKKYRESVAAEILVLNQCLELANLENLQGELNDLLIIIRADTKQAKTELHEYIGFMEYVEKLANAAAETSFLSGAEYPSFSLSDAIYDSQKRIAQQLEKNKLTADELLELQKQVILKAKNKPEEESIESEYSGPLEGDSDTSEEIKIVDPTDKPTHTIV